MVGDTRSVNAYQSEQTLEKKKQMVKLGYKLSPLIKTIVYKYPVQDNNHSYTM